MNDNGFDLKRVRDVAIDGALVLCFVVLLAVELPL